ncbi:ABC transporter permease [Candidatus Acetothermia bacterium]|nr:ABC transporter permease [Candidatus Acetothermia bacterium]MCI2431384.1 ABC transporter permease [Candidatus Acetothermia bacterium]MCI2435832.1 ABC transporter permease [Candidatus Acetothermia bacterium]
MIKRLLKNPISVTGLVLVLFFTLIALAAPVLAPPPRPCQPLLSYWVPAWILEGFGQKVQPCNPYKIPQDGRWATPKPPSEKHPMGTTAYQYDILYGLIWGTRTAFNVGLTVTLSILLIGLVLGALSGYYGRWVDELLMRITEIFLAFPFLVAAMVLTAILGRGLDKVMIALVVFGWPTYARLVRGEVLSAKEREYVLAARASGASDFRIIFRHVLPNTIYPALVLASLDMGSMVLSAAALSFLGLGSGTGYADWGQMISFTRNYLTDLDEYWYTVIYPGGAILFFVLGWNLLGDAFRDVLDPRLRGVKS